MTTTRSNDRRARRRVLTAAGIALALLVAACSSDDDPNSDAASTTVVDSSLPPDTGSLETTTSGVESSATIEGSADVSTETEIPAEPEVADKDPVRVVALFSLSGPSIVTVGTAEVSQATVGAINAAGGLNGHPIELEIVDTTGDVATAQSAIVEAVDDGAVAFLMSTPITETSTAQQMADTGIAVLGVGYSPSVWGGSVGEATCETAPENWCAKPNHFTIATTFAAVVAEQVLGAKAAGATKLGVASCAEVDSCSYSNPVFIGVAAVEGLQFVTPTQVNSAAADYSAECIAWIQDDVDFVQISGGELMGVNLMSSCADQGYDGLWGASAGTVGGDLLEQPYGLAGGLNAFPWWVDDPPVVEYRERMQAAGLSEELYAGAVMTGMYSSLLLLDEAVSDYADPDAPLDAAAVLAAMHQVTDETLDGLIVPVSFDENDLDRERPCFWPYVKDADGTFSNPLGGLNYQCFPEE